MKRGQLKLFETIGVLIVFIILIGFALIFYNTIQQSSFEEENQQLQEARSMKIAEKALLLPDLDCSLRGIIETSCVDELKLIAIEQFTNSTSKTTQEYFDIFETSAITISTLYPVEKKFVVYNQSPNATTSQQKFTAPIIIRDPRTETSMFGLMEVITYG
jgi:hypothetical protein